MHAQLQRLARNFPISEKEIHMGLITRNLSSGFPPRSYTNKPAQLPRIARTIEVLPVASFDKIHSNKRITKVLIRLCRCVGWSAPLLFTNPEDRFSRVETHL